MSASLGDFFAALSAHDPHSDEDDGKTEWGSIKRDPDIVIDVLKEAAPRYVKNDWQFGDVVTARRGVGLKGHGEPMIVLETRGREFDFDTTAGSRDYGLLCDTRVLLFVNDVLFPIWVDGADLERWSK